MFLIKVWSLLLATVVTVPAPVINYRRVAEKDLRYSVLLHMRGSVVVKDREGKSVTRKVFAGCSGTYVSPTKILTAAHCFEGYAVEKIWARGPEDVLGYPVKVVASNHEFDLAIVRAAFPHSFASVGNTPHVGDEVLNIGSPLGFEFVSTQGIVSALGFTIPGKGATFTVTTAMIDHGSSGGGVFNKKGQLIGVNTLSVGLFGWGGLALAVNDTTVKEFLRGI